MLAVADKQQSSWSISDLAAEFAVTPRTIRFYEDEGLIGPERVGTSRLYSKRDRARLAWILRGKRLGFSLADIRELLDLYDAGDGRRTQRERTIAKCRERIAALEAQRGDLDDMITELQQFTATLGDAPAKDR